MKTCLGLLLLCCATPLYADTPNWVVYQEGGALQLAIDANSLWLEQDGLVHFVHQERFSKKRFEKAYRLSYNIRRTRAYADCKNYQFVFVSSDYFDRKEKRLFSTLFPVPRHSWKWQPVYDDSVAAAMMKVVCDAAGAATTK
ncbi:surface-adhesin E family protein [Neisseriaceae bacterium TC5R-5]|nr:surface-adhesin E family protein [Neisseriaceae bacterium TC5R-5]